MEVPGHHQAVDPLGYGDRVEGLDLSGGECEALVAYVRGLPAPIVNWRTSPDGKKTFDSIGCAACSRAEPGRVEGLYSDLLLHDMGEELQDTGGYGTFTPRSPGEEINLPVGPLASARNVAPDSTVCEQKPLPTAAASRLQWRTPPLCGVSDLAPYLHDGRAPTLDAAIRLHGGEAIESSSPVPRFVCRGAAASDQVPAGHASSGVEPPSGPTQPAADLPGSRHVNYRSDLDPGGRLGFTPIRFASKQIDECDESVSEPPGGCCRR